MSVGIVAVDEMARAYQAAVSGEFRSLARQHSSNGRQAKTTWTPNDGEQLVLVVGCGGGRGTSTVALAIVEAAAGGRVVECCSAGASGLAAASTAEMGSASNGWVRGSRGELLIEHRPDLISALADLPAPAESNAELTVLDYSGDITVLLESEGWLGEIARSAPSVIAVSRPTVPGLRRLETAVDVFGEERVVAALVGLGRRLPRPVVRALGPASRRLLVAGGIHPVPHDPGLAFTGPGTAPLPAPLLAAAADLLVSVKGPLA